jgi:hypothetical protein
MAGWIFGHEDWVRHASGRLYLECLDCGRETPDGRRPETRPAPGCTIDADPSAIGSLIGTSARQEPPRHRGEMPMAA